MIYTPEKAIIRLLPNLMKDATKVGEAMVMNNKMYHYYCLVLEDVKNTKLVGKIVILQYDNKIRKEIMSERNGGSGQPCNIFDLSKGKNLILNKDSISFGKFSSFPIFNAETGDFKNVPLVDGNIDPRFRTAIKDILLNRECELESL